MFNPSDIGIILSYLCAGGCRHCLYSCGPGWESQPMSVSELHAALLAVTQWPTPPQVHLTGGEPFLHYPLLLEGARAAAEMGISAYVETSASWCTGEDLAVARFQALEEAGLAAVLISCSPFHAERIPPARTLTAVRAALTVFGPERVIVHQPQYLAIVQRFGAECTTPLSRYEESFGAAGAGRLLWDGYGIISGGRAGYALGHLRPPQPAVTFRHASCAAEILHAHHSHFDLYGHYISGFCGGLCIGAWHDLPALMRRFDAGDYPELIGVLVHSGPYGLLQLARARHGYVEPSAGYSGKCHMCVDVRRHLAAAADYAELRPRAFYDNL